MASLCKRQQCTIERRGFRQELDSWRHKLIHCVGKLSWHCVCASVWRGPGGRWVPAAVFACVFGGVERAVAVMSTGKPVGSREAVIFCYARLLPGAACHPPDTSKNILLQLCGLLPGVLWCFAGRLGVCDLFWRLVLVVFRVSVVWSRGGIFNTMFYSCLFIVSRECHVFRWSCASANRLPRYRLARARVARPRVEFLVRGRGGRCALSISKHDGPSSSSSSPSPIPWKSAFGNAHCCIGGNVSGNNFVF